MADKNNRHPTGAGRSSFGLIDSEKFFRELDLQAGITFLDVACGRGAYCLKAAEIIGPAGTVYGIDLWSEGIENLKRDAAATEARNITALVVDAGRHIPIENRCVDVCLLATVLHDFVHDHIADAVLREILRVLRPAATLAVVEFNKIDGPPGPPRHIKLSPQEVTALLTSYGLKTDRLTDIGPHNYLITFKRI